jgi:protein O-GlcNAc transferase
MIPRHPPLNSVLALRRQALAAARSGQLAQAQELLETALRQEPGDVATVINLGAVFQAQFDRRQALACYEQALMLDPAIPEAWNNRSLILSDLGEYKEARLSAERALQIRPNYPEALNNLGIAAYGMGDKRSALLHYKTATSQRPGYARAWGNSGALHFEFGDWPAALTDLERALTLDPQADQLPGLAQHVRMKLADWGSFDQTRNEILQAIDRGQSPCSPFAALALFDDPIRHKLIAERWAGQKLLPPNPNLINQSSQRNVSQKRIKVGYFSGDFHHHATSQLITGLLEKHDRQQFEIIGFSFGPEIDDAMSRRVLQSFDTAINVREWSDRQIIERARALNLDIAVDLKGYTQDSRANIFALRAAPIQISYLGYPGTLGLSSMDYIIADPIVTPEGAEPAYIEKIIRLPDTYQANDLARPRALCNDSRRDHGLPDNEVVFCCFNNTYKILPEVFELWMRILKEIPKSVLWLLADHDLTMRNLRCAAEQSGVAADRLVFAPRVATTAHLARHCHADIMLDTFPYNAHTTASDALWMGVPLITRMGDSFASRVAASLLHACDLPELITDNQHDYKKTAIELASDRQRRENIRTKLIASRDSARLFDVNRFTLSIEAAYKKAVERLRKGLPPDHMNII